jgi:transcription antitermination factor NusG
MWHVLQTAPHKEPQVCKFLALQGLPSYAPEFGRVQRTRPGSVRDTARHWIFPGYVFFQVPDGYSRWDPVRWAPGVRRLLQQDGSPAFVDDTVMERLRLRVVAMARPRHGGAGFQTGQRVVIERGPLAMVDALFDRCLKASDRVSVLVQLLGRLVAVEVDPVILRAAG